MVSDRLKQVIILKGYYVWAAPMDTLSDSDKEQRTATPIQVAVKLAGAIHFVDIIVNYNR